MPRYENRETVYVAGFGPDVDEDDLAKLFGKYGDVLMCQIRLDHETRESRGFGFVTMATEKAAKRVRRKLNGTTWRSRTLIVREAGVPKR